MVEGVMLRAEGGGVETSGTGEYKKALSNSKNAPTNLEVHK